MNKKPMRSTLISAIISIAILFVVIKLVIEVPKTQNQKTKRTFSEVSLSTSENMRKDKYFNLCQYAMELLDKNNQRFKEIWPGSDQEYAQYAFSKHYHTTYWASELHDSTNYKFVYNRMKQSIRRLIKERMEMQKLPEEEIEEELAFAMTKLQKKEGSLRLAAVSHTR